MKAKYILVLLMFLFAVPVIATAQDNSNPTQSEVVKAKVGTYQFQITETKSQLVFSDEILVEVELKRQQSETVYMTISPGVVVMIPSRDAINEPTFVPLEEVVYQ
jgi:uncharacterized protein YpmS